MNAVKSLDKTVQPLLTTALDQDLRNHGESPHAPRNDYPAMAEDVAAFLAQHGLKNPTLIGHSM